MPRRERPLESEDSPLLRFAGDLRRLRHRAGEPTYRELGRRANYSAAALSEAVSGRRLPSLAVTVAFVRACDGDVGEWTARWRELASGQPGDPGEVPSPYVGLAAYQVEDADRFFGREALTATLLALVEDRPFVGVFGASGVGKSSLLRAGLAARSPRTALVVTPGADPVDEFAVALAALADEPAVRVREDLAAGPQALRVWMAKAADDLLLVVDQFEECFTLCDDTGRDWLIRALTQAAGPRSRVVIGVRADFYGRCGAHPDLVAALHRAQVLVGPMSTEEFRWAVTEPATRAGASLQTALVARLISDVAGQPAALPLVSHTLAEVWRRRRGLALTLSGYQDVGGMKDALARTAEQTYGELDEAGRAAARLLFLRLVVPGDGTEDTRRRVPRSGLGTPDAILERLAAARLISIGRDSVELAHEALLHAWPRLAGWIARDRDDLRTQHRIAEATAIWETHGRDPDSLYRGARLEQAARLRERLTVAERAFVEAGLAAERAAEAAVRRSARRLRGLVAVLAVLTVLLAGTAIAAVAAQRAATAQRNEALALRVVDVARGMLANRPKDAEVLALAAYRIAPIAESRDMLVLAHAAATATTLGMGYATTPGHVAITKEPAAGGRPAGSLLWRPSSGSWEPAGELPTEDMVLYGRSGNDRVMLYGSLTTDAVLWDLSDLDAPRRIDSPVGLGVVQSMSQDGSVMAGVTSDGTAVLWRVGERAPRRLPAADVQNAALLPDGSGVILCRRVGGAFVLEQWSADGALVGTLFSAPDRISPSVGPDGIVATILESGEVVMIDAGDRRAVRTVARVDGFTYSAKVTFDPAGNMLALTDLDRVALVNAATGEVLISLDARGLDLSFPRIEDGRIAVLSPGGELWQLDGDLNRVIRELCAARPLVIDWDRYFPGAGPQRLCR